MFKYIFPLVVLASTPTQAQSISYERIKEIAEKAEVVCPIAAKKKGNAVSTIYSLVPTYSDEEKLFILSLCNLYIRGYINGILGK
jgi:hypothetical protein